MVGLEVDPEEEAGVQGDEAAKDAGVGCQCCVEGPAMLVVGVEWPLGTGV